MKYNSVQHLYAVTLIKMIKNLEKTKATSPKIEFGQGNLAEKLDLVNEIWLKKYFWSMKLKWRIKFSKWNLTEKLILVNEIWLNKYFWSLKFKWRNNFGQWNLTEQLFFINENWQKNWWNWNQWSKSSTLFLSTKKSDRALPTVDFLLLSSYWNIEL